MVQLCVCVNVLMDVVCMYVFLRAFVCVWVFECVCACSSVCVFADVELLA